MATSLTIGVAIVRAAFSSGASDADDLRTLLRNWTRLEERENVEQDLVASLSVPGYLETADGDGVKVYVPVNLCRVSPTRAQREGIHSNAPFLPPKGTVRSPERRSFPVLPFCCGDKSSDKRI